MANRVSNRRRVNNKLKLMIFIIILSSGAVITRDRNSSTVGGIKIKKIIFTSKLDKDDLPVDSQLKFDTKIPRIYCVILFDSILKLPFSATMSTQWFYNSEQIYSHYFSTASEPVILWMEPPGNQFFQPGIYTVKFFMGRTHTTTMQFEVE